MTLQVNFIYNTLPEKYLRLVLNYEGGYVNDPDDKGGETNRGITIGALNRAKKQGLVSQNVTIRSLTNDLESVRRIYGYNYYRRSKANLMPHPLSFAHFDASVNHGSGNSGKFLQRSLNKFEAKIEVDGLVGPKTLTALNKTLKNVQLFKLIKNYCDVRETFYYAIVANHPSQRKYINGWMNRLNSVRKYCGVL